MLAATGQFCLIVMRCEYKMAKEVNAVRLRPHPYEFALYDDA
jgi:hypothetical protein